MKLTEAQRKCLASMGADPNGSCVEGREFKPTQRLVHIGYATSLRIMGKYYRFTITDAGRAALLKEVGR